MKILVVYRSKTEFTKRYAEVIAKELECKIMEFKEVTAEIMAGYDAIVYGGGLYAGMVNGFKQAKEMFIKSGAKEFVVFATGGTPNEAVEPIEQMWQNNLSSEELEQMPHFYMQAGICYEKMALTDKAIMKMAAVMMSKKKNKDDYDTGFEQAIKKSYDIFSEEYAKPLIDYLKEKEF